MNKVKYQEMIKEMTPKENKLLNMVISFFTGGLIGIISTFIYLKLNQVYKQDLAIAFTLLILIATTALLTGLGFCDSLFCKLKCGLIIPITGFAHSVASSILDYKREGFLNMGANAFKLAGCVILYGVVSAIILTIIKVITNV